MARLRSKEEYAALLSHPNAQRALETIRYAEGTARRDDPYRVGFGFSHISDLTDHPRTFAAYANTRTSAAGAYQALSRSWDEVANKLDLPDFGPRSQDIFALARMDYRDALEPALKGDFDKFVQRANKEWASFPGSPYGQPVKNKAVLKSVWENWAPEDVPTPTRRPGAIPGPIPGRQPYNPIGPIQDFAPSTIARSLTGNLAVPSPSPANLPASVMDRIAGFAPTSPAPAMAATPVSAAPQPVQADRRAPPMSGLQQANPIGSPQDFAPSTIARAMTGGIAVPARAQPNVPTPTARPSFGLSDAVMSRMPDMPATMPSLADMRTKAAPQTAALPASVAERMAGFPAMGSLNDVTSYRGTMGQPDRSMPANVPAPSSAPRNNIEAAAKQLGAPVTAGFSGATMRGLLGAIGDEKPQIQSAPLNAPKADRVISQAAPKVGRVADQQSMIQSRFDNAPMDTPAMTQMVAEPKDYLSDRYGTRAQPASLQARTPTVAPTRANAMQGPQIASRAFAEAPSIGPTPTARPSLTASPRVGPTSVSSFAPVQAPRTAPTVPEPPARTRSIAPRTVNDPIAVADRQTRSLGAPSIPDAPRQTGGLLGAIGNAFGGVSDTMGGFGGVAGGLLGGAIAGPAGAVVGSMVGRAFNGNTGGGNLSQTARSALANGWSGFGPAQSYADFSRSSGGGGNFSGNSAPRGLFGERNDAASSALPGKTTTYSDGRTERDGPSKSSGSGKGKR